MLPAGQAGQGPVVPALWETREKEQELKLLLVTPLQGEEPHEKAADTVEDLRNEVGDCSAVLAVPAGTGPRDRPLGWPALPERPLRSHGPGAAVQHQLPRVQRSGQHQHEVSAYPSSGVGVGLQPLAVHLNTRRSEAVAGACPGAGLARWAVPGEGVRREEGAGGSQPSRLWHSLDCLPQKSRTSRR